MFADGFPQFFLQICCYKNEEETFSSFYNINKWKPLFNDCY